MHVKLNAKLYPIQILLIVSFNCFLVFLIKAKKQNKTEDIYLLYGYFITI